jgi:hypothetical protein
MTEEQHRAKAAKIAEIVLVGGSALCVLVSFSFFYYYGWTPERGFSTKAGPILSYVLPLSLAGLLFASLRLRPAYKVTLGLFLVSTGVSIFVVELVLVLTKRPPSKEGAQKRVEAARKLGVNYDTRDRLEVVTELRQKGIDAVPAIPSDTLLRRQGDSIMKSDITIDGTEVLPLGGIANKVTVLCNENGTYVSYESDEHGFQNPQGSWTAGRIDIAALGDSFTHGFCVPSDQNFVALIRKQWPATLNVANHGNGPLTMLATLKEYIQPLKPQVVLWFYFENDLAD